MFKSDQKVLRLVGIAVFVLCISLFSSISFATSGDFTIGAYSPPPVGYVNSTQYDYLEEANINQIAHYYQYWQQQDDLAAEINENINSLNLCAQRSIEAICLDARMTDWANRTDAEIDAIVDTYKDYPATAGYFVYDEPSALQFSTLGHVYQRMLQRDPDSAPFVNLLPSAAIAGSYLDHVNGWINAAGSSNLKYLYYDRYPFLVGGVDASDYFQNLEQIRSAGLAANVNTGCFLQSVGIETTYRRPTENEMRYNVYTCLSYGMKSLYWFTWWQPTNQNETFTTAIMDAYGNKTDLFIPVKTLNGQIKELGPTLMSLTSEDIYHAGNIPQGASSIPANYFWQPTTAYNQIVSHFIQTSTNRSYVMVVNRDYQNSRTLSFNLPSIPANVTEISKIDGTEINTNYSDVTGNISGTFAPGEGRLYAISTDFQYNVKHEGLDSIGGTTDEAGVDHFAAVKVTPGQDMSVNVLNLYVAENATGNVKMAIYTSINDSPGARIAQTASVPLVNGWNSAGIAATNLTAGTDYWLVFDLSQNGSVLTYNSTGTLKYVSYDFDLDLPYVAPAMTTTTMATYSFYASGTGISGNTCIGLNSIGDYSGIAGNNYFCAVRVSPKDNVTVDTLKLYVTSAASGNARMAIYSNNNGSPETLLAQTGSVPLVNGWNSGSITATNLSAGTDYWLVMDLSNSGVELSYNTTGTLKYSSYAYGALPAEAPAMTTTTAATYSFYACGSGHVGLDTVGSTTGEAGVNNFHAISITPNRNISAKKLNLYVASGATGNVRMAIYSDNAGSPGTLLAQTGDIALQNGWNSGSISTTNLAYGTEYWLVFDLSQSSNILAYNTSGTLKYGVYPYGVLPATSPTMTTTTTATYSFYASE